MAELDNVEADNVNMDDIDMSDLEADDMNIDDIDMSDPEAIRRFVTHQQRIVAHQKRIVAREKRRRKKAEQAVQPQTLMAYLERCHAFSLAIQVIMDPTKTTKGDTTNPVGRIFPRRIIPWHDFAERQEEIWAQLADPAFTSEPQFPSQHQLDYVRSAIFPLSSEEGLRIFESNTVEVAVQKLIGAVNSNPRLRDRLGLKGVVAFESHVNLGNDEPLERKSSDHHGNARDATHATTPPRKAVSKLKGVGKGNRADQFCIYETSDDIRMVKTAIEYKAPHKLLQDEVTTGLVSEIQPERDVINIDGEGFAFTSRTLAAAVVTQLFSYMVGIGIQYGYVCTGQTFIFLHIPDDPTVVYYSVSVPQLDVLDDDETRLHRTAVAQVFAFVLQSLRAEPPPQSWYDAAAELKTWAVEYDDVLKRIPETVRKERRVSPYIPPRWKGFQRSPIIARSRCKPPEEGSSRRRHNDGDSSGEESSSEGAIPDSPTPVRAAPSGSTAATSSAVQNKEQRQGGKHQQHPIRIQDRLYCTHECLLGLSQGGPLDPSCPNVDDHGKRHVELPKFLRLLRAQLAVDRGRDADSMPLFVSGAVGSIFKLRLSAYGYTLVAKGVQTGYQSRLRHENSVYGALHSVQGKHVPVCLGIIDLVLPYYFDGGAYEHLLLLSWAGKPLIQCLNMGEADKARVVSAVSDAFMALHRLQVLHTDAEPRNIMCGEKIMVVDFERAKLYGRLSLGAISPNSQQRKRKREKLGGKPSEPEADSFSLELEHVVRGVTRYIVP